MAYRTDGRPSVPILRGGVWPIRPDGTMQEEEEEVEEKKVEEPKEASTLRPPRPQLPKPKPTTRFVPSASTLRPRPTQRPKPKPKPRFVPSLGSLRPPSPSAKPKPRFVPSVLTFPDPGPFNFNNLPDEVPLVGEEGYHAPPNSPAEPPHPGPGPSNSNNRADEVPLVGEEPPSLPWDVEDYEADDSHWWQEHKRRCQARSCICRFPVVGDRVYSQIGHQSGSRFDHWWLAGYEVALVVKVDDDGDFHAIDPRGNVSPKLCRKDFCFFQDEVPLVGEEGNYAPPNSPAEPQHPGPGPSNSNNRAEEPPSLPNFTEDDEAIRAEDLRQDRKDMQVANEDRRKRGKRPYKSLLEYWGFVGPDGEPIE